MPLIVRSIGPAYVSRKKLDRSIRDELEGVSFNSLVGILQQISSLAHHAGEVFGELSTESESIFDRTVALKKRVDKIMVAVNSLDPNEEQFALANANMRKPFKSTYTAEQQVLSRSNLPNALLRTYEDAKRPPNLRLMNAYRDDNKDSLKFYTDPQYFFDLWVKAMVEETEKRQKAHRRRKQARREIKINQIEKKVYNPQGEEFGGVTYVKQPPVTVVPSVPIEPEAEDDEEDEFDVSGFDKKTTEQSVVIAEEASSVHYYRTASPEPDDDEDNGPMRSPTLPPPPQPFSLDDSSDFLPSMNRQQTPSVISHQHQHHESHKDNQAHSTPERARSAGVTFAPVEIEHHESVMDTSSHASYASNSSPAPDKSVLSQSLKQSQNTMPTASFVHTDNDKNTHLPATTAAQGLPPPMTSSLGPRVPVPPSAAPPPLTEASLASMKAQEPKIASVGSNLLSAIKNKKLRKVQEEEIASKERRPTGIFASDVESIIKRRKWVCSSDEDDGTSSTESEWNDSDDTGYY